MLLCFFLVCCGCDSSDIVSVHIQCQASIYTLSLCRGHSWRVRLAKQETLTPPGHLVSPLVCRGPWMSTGALLLAPQWQCISSFVFHIKSPSNDIVEHYHILWQLPLIYTEQKKKGIILVMLPFSVLVESGYMRYEILLTAISYIGLFHKFRDQPSVKGPSRQWVEFQKVRAGRISTTKIRICVDRRYLYFFPDRKSTQSWTKSYALERNSVQKMVGFVMTECWKRKHRTKTVLPLVNGYFHHIMQF